MTYTKITLLKYCVLETHLYLEKFRVIHFRKKYEMLQNSSNSQYPRI